MTDKEAIDDAIYVIRGLLKECKELDAPIQARINLEAALDDIVIWKESLP